MKIDDSQFIKDTIQNVTKIFRAETENGLLELIVPPAKYYPDFSSIKTDQVFNDSSDRVRWRTKQNYDISYLMAYAQKRGNYYLQVNSLRHQKKCITFCFDQN